MKMRWLLGLLLALTAVSLIGDVPPTQAQSGGVTIRLSLADDGAEADGDSSFPAVSGDGRFVAFESLAANLTDDVIPNGGARVYLRDRDTDADGVFDEAGATTTRLIALNDAGEPADGVAVSPDITPDGRYVAFASAATNLHPNAPDTTYDIYVRDRAAGSAAHVSIASDGTDANQQSYQPSISDDGRYVVFHSWADNLTPDDTNGLPDIFLHDRDADGDGIYDEAGAVLTRRISVGIGATNSDGRSEYAVISGDGSSIAFASAAGNLVDGDANGKWDIFVSDRSGGDINRVSIAADGTEADGDSGDPINYRLAISGDGRFVAFASQATNLVTPAANGLQNVFLHDRDADADGVFDEAGAIAVIRVSQSTSGGDPDNHADYPAITPDGRFIAYHSAASNIVDLSDNGERDVYLYDSETGATRLASIAADGRRGDDDSTFPALGADDQQVFFDSAATNFVAQMEDTNGVDDVFVNTAADFGPPPPPINWQRQLLDARGYSGQYSDLALDEDGRPHIAYARNWGARDALIYMRWDGVAWQKEVVDAETAVGGAVSLALDGDGRAHIAYHGNQKRDLHYAYWDGAAWRRSQPLPLNQSVIGRFHDIDASFGQVHITYLDETARQLRYITGSGGNWSPPQTIGATGSLWPHSLARDAQGGLHVSYHNSADGDLMLAHREGNAWVSETVAGMGNAGVSSSLVYDGDGRPHIAAAVLYDRFILHYYHHDGDAWIEETIAADTNKSLGQFQRLALDSFGRPVVAYVDDTERELMLARRTGPNLWQTETADANNISRVGGLALDGADIPHVSYFDNNYRDLHYATGADPWQFRVVYDNLNQPNDNPSLALNGQAPAVSFHTESTAPTSLVAAPWDGDAWADGVVATVGDAAIRSSLVYDEAGRAHLAYYAPAERQLTYAVGTPPVWQRTAVYTLPAGVSIGPDIELMLTDPNRRPAIAYSAYEPAAGPKLVLAQQENDGTWTQTETADPTAAAAAAPFAPLAADYRYGGGVSVVYYNAAANGVNIATFSGGEEAEWVIEAAAEDVAAAAVDVAVTRRRLSDGSPDNTPALAYADAAANQIVYVRWQPEGDPAGWTPYPAATLSQSVDSLALATINHATNRPRIAYITADNAVSLAGADTEAFAWTVETVAGAGTAVRAQIDLAFAERERLAYIEDGAVVHAFRSAAPRAAAAPGEAKTVLEEMHTSFCYCLWQNALCGGGNGSGAGATAASSLARTAVVAIPANDGAVLDRLTDLFLATPEGSDFVDLYFTHDYELGQILMSDPSLAWDSFRALENLMPGLTAFTRGRGNQVVIDQAMIDQALDVWQRVAAKAGPELTAVIDQYLTDSNNLGDYVGLTFDEWAATLGVEPPPPVYLPLVVR